MAAREDVYLGRRRRIREVCKVLFEEERQGELSERKTLKNSGILFQDPREVFLRGSPRRRPRAGPRQEEGARRRLLPDTKGEEMLTHKKSLFR